MKKIVFTGGGTAGHVMPNVALFNYLDDYKKYYLGGSIIDKNIIKKYDNITYYDIPCSKLKRSLSLSNILLPFKLIKSIKRCKKILKGIRPNVVFSKGGYVSVPVCIAAKMLHIPIITHESDISLGLANKIIATFADKVLCSFDCTVKKNKKYIYTGTPLRKELLLGKKENIAYYHKLDTNKKTILVFGGSLGAKTINEFIFQNVNSICKYYNLIIITGKGKRNNAVTHDNFIQVEYAENIADYFKVADYVISRAGSNAIFELFALHKKALLIPLTHHSRGEQLLNAEYFKKKNLVDIMLEDELSLDLFLDKIKNLDKLNTPHIDLECTNLGIIKEITSII